MTQTAVGPHATLEVIVRCPKQAVKAESRSVVLPFEALKPFLSTRPLRRPPRVRLART